MVDGIKTVPTAERKRQYRALAGGYYYGEELRQAERAERKRQQARFLQEPAQEDWPQRMKGGIRPHGLTRLQIRRDGYGRFAPPLTSKEYAERARTFLESQTKGENWKTLLARYPKKKGPGR